MPFRLLRGALGAAAALIVSAAAAHAAVPPAPPIVGIVRDEQGNPLPQARVTIAEISRSTTSAGDGTFGFRSLRPGTYHLDVTLLGYTPGHAVVSVPEAGADVRVEIVLR